MFATKPQMRHCPDCRAPNPQSRNTCYACGVRLDRVDPNVAHEGEQTYPCVNCDRPLPYRAVSCPHCGKEVAPTAPVSDTFRATLPPPDGWKATPLPDGTTLLTRTGMERINWRLNHGIGAAFWAAVMIAYVVYLVARPGRYSRVSPLDTDLLHSPAFWAGAVVIGTGALVSLVWLIFGRDELRVGPKMMDICRALGPYYRRKQITAEWGMLYLREYETYVHRSRSIFGGEHVVVTELRVEYGGERILLDEKREKLGFMTGMFSGGGCENVHALANFLASVTGWKIINAR